MERGKFRREVQSEVFLSRIDGVTPLVQGTVSKLFSLAATLRRTFLISRNVNLTRGSAPFCNRDIPSLATSVLYTDSVGGEHEQQLRILVWGDVVQIRTARSRQ